MNKPNRKLQTRAQRLARKFFDDAQALYDDPEMDDATNETEIFQTLVLAQSSAEDVMNAESHS